MKAGIIQICTLKQSSSEVRKRQEVGRGLRLCVNNAGDRMDTGVLGSDVHNINVLTVIASESYESFARGLQSEMAEAVADRPIAVTDDLFIGRTYSDTDGQQQIIDVPTARSIMFYLTTNQYVDETGTLTDKYYEDKANGTIDLSEKHADKIAEVVAILEGVYNPSALMPENARSNNVELKFDEEKFKKAEFQKLWNNINSKTYYVVDFNSNELISKAISELNAKGKNLVTKISYTVETGSMSEIKSKEALLNGEAFKREKISSEESTIRVAVNNTTKYDLVGKLVTETGLTRKDIVAILTGIEKLVFDQFKYNPEEFIAKTSAIINSVKASSVIEHITYDVLDEKYQADIFTDATIKGKLDHNVMKANKHLYDHIVYDSSNEREFAEKLDVDDRVAAYVKLPKGFYISTPVGKYNPDWAIAFYEGKVKHIYFVAETKGSIDSMELRLIENAKISCAKEHFKAISNEVVVYDVVNSYEKLMELVTK